MSFWIGGLSALLVFGSLLVLIRMSRFTDIQGFALRHRVWIYGFSIATTTFGVAQILSAANKDVFSIQELIMTAALVAIVCLIVLMPVVLLWPSRKFSPTGDSRSLLRAPGLNKRATSTKQQGGAGGEQLDTENPEHNLLLELPRMIRRFERALLGSKITIFAQDQDLSYTWIHNAPAGFGAAAVIGRKDHELLPLETALPLIEAKRRSLEEEKPQRIETTVEIEGVEHCFDVNIEPMYDEGGMLDGIISIAVDITEQKESESHLRLITREVNHRLKNLLAVTQAMARQSAAYAKSPDEFIESFVGRLQGLAQSHDLLVQEAWRGGSLVELINGQIGHLLPATKTQIILVGSDLRLSVDATQNIGMALHELATNAAKYGALSSPQGKVKISWRKVEDSGNQAHLHLRWSENGGPPVKPQSKKGFGYAILQEVTARALGAEVETDFAHEGLRWEIRVPWEHVVE